MKPTLETAYFTMEIGLQSDMPTYAGGLGMLAADIMRSSADLGLDMACMTIAWQHGYLEQHILPDGSQEYALKNWNIHDFLRLLEPEITVQIEGKTVYVRAWVLDVKGEKSVTPIYFLDTNFEKNAPEFREITYQLYGGDSAMRLKQEVVLGIGGVKMLRALGYMQVGTYHMNEGHAAFLTLELLRENDFNDAVVKQMCAFTTHTPIKAGHDTFPYALAYKIVGDALPWHIKKLASESELSMTKLALNLSRYTCGVAQIHGEVSRAMFPGYEIDAITNGVHHVHWASEPLRQVLDVYIPGWRQDSSLLATKIYSVPDQELWRAHMQAKTDLISHVNSFGHTFDPQFLTIASARRVVPYKRPELLYDKIERLIEISNGKLQIIHAGNAYPGDAFSQGVVQRIVERGRELGAHVKIAYIEKYNPDLAKMLVSGADVWLNTPQRLLEASGTSGMKACMNGVLNLSTLDGWWIEGYSKNHEAGWRIGPLVTSINTDADIHIDAEDLYTQLQFEIMPEYYNDRSRWITRMKAAISLLSYFSSQRCAGEYQEKVWSKNK